jgi:hypothetical protein
MTPVLIPCSRNAHDQNVLVRRPQWDRHGCHSRREKRASLEGQFDVRSLWQVGPWSPGVGFRCRAAWAGEDLVEPFQGLLAQCETQRAHRSV